MHPALLPPTMDRLGSLTLVWQLDEREGFEIDLG